MARSCKDYAVKAVPLFLSVFVPFLMLAAGANAAPGKTAAGAKPDTAAKAPVSTAKGAVGLLKSFSSPNTAAPVSAKSPAENGSVSADEEVNQDPISEDVIPMSLEADPQSTVRPDTVLSVRLRSDGGIDPMRIHATIDGKPVDPRDLKWRPTEKDNNTDGWAMVTPSDKLPMGTVTLAVTATAASGEAIQPKVETYTVAGREENFQEGDTPELEQVPGVEPLPESVAAPGSMPYRIKPSEVYAEPMTVQIEVPDGGNPDDYEIYFYSESTEHCGWYPAASVSGWMIPDSRKPVEESGKSYIEIQINHSGIVQPGLTPGAPQETSQETSAKSSGADRVNMKRILDALLQIVSQFLIQTGPIEGK